MNTDTKYGLFTYETENIGDEVQSVAARRFLPRVDYLVSRDDINGGDFSEGVKVIMNGWFTHHPENWPPKVSGIDPLLISMHVEQEALNGKVADAFSTRESIEFLNKYGPVGARNKPTYEFLQKIGVDSYFSGCVTLTLIPDKNIRRRDFILAVDVSDKVYAAMRERSSGREIIRIDTSRSPKMKHDTKILLAEYWLFLYQSAHAVVTTRLHCMLPCLALGTPVFAISGRDPERYRGLIELTNHGTEKDFLRDEKAFNLDKPPKNPEDYKKIRAEVEKRCAEFTGYDSKKSFLNGKKMSDIYAEPTFMRAVCDGIYATLERDLARGDAKYLDELRKAHELKIKQLETRIIELEVRNKQLSNDLAAAENPGIKDASRKLGKAIKRRLN